MDGLLALGAALGNGGGGGGTKNYEALTNLPQINGVTLIKNKTTQELHILLSGNDAFDDYEDAVDAINEWAKDHRGIGDNVYIRAREVPDMWISEVEDTSVEYEYTTDAAFINALMNNTLQIGYYKFSALETQKVLVPDIQIEGTSIVIDGIANIPVANGTLGVVKIQGSGLSINASTGAVSIAAAGNSVIESKGSSYQPIVPTNLDKAIMEGLGNNSLTWSDAYKAAARNTIGIKPEVSFACEMADGTSKTLKLYAELV